MRATGDHGRASTDDIEQIAEAIEREQTVDVPAELLLAVSYQESRWWKRDVSRTHDYGLFQIHESDVRRGARPVDDTDYHHVFTEEVFDIGWSTHHGALILQHVRRRMTHEEHDRNLIDAWMWVGGYFTGNPVADCPRCSADRVAHRRSEWLDYAYTIRRFLLTFRQRLTTCRDAGHPGYGPNAGLDDGEAGE